MNNKTFRKVSVQSQNSDVHTYEGFDSTYGGQDSSDHSALYHLSNSRYGQNINFRSSCAKTCLSEHTPLSSSYGNETSCKALADKLNLRFKKPEYGNWKERSETMKGCNILKYDGDDRKSDFVYFNNDTNASCHPQGTYNDVKKFNFYKVASSKECTAGDEEWLDDDRITLGDCLVKCKNKDGCEHIVWNAYQAYTTYGDKKGWCAWEKKHPTNSNRTCDNPTYHTSSGNGWKYNIYKIGQQTWTPYTAECLKEYNSNFSDQYQTLNKSQLSSDITQAIPITTG